MTGAVTGADRIVWAINTLDRRAVERVMVEIRDEYGSAKARGEWAAAVAIIAGRPDGYQPRHRGVRS